MTRDVETIDQELRLLAAVRYTVREMGGRLSTARVDELLDERQNGTGGSSSSGSGPGG